jgi:hypothetical protein
VVASPEDPLSAELARCVNRRAASRSVLVAHDGAVDTALLQRALIPNGQPGAGRLPANERWASLKTMLALNGYADDLLYTKAMWNAEHKDKLETYWATIKDLNERLEDKFVTGHKRERIRARLAEQYASLLDQAATAIQDTNDEYTDRVEQAGTIMESWRKGQHKSGVFKGDWKVLGPLVAVPRAGLSFVTEDKFMTNAVSAQKRLAKGNVPAPGLTATQKLELAAEQQAINTQLAAWRNVLWQPGQAVPGVNVNGTWGTSATGAGVGFQISRVSPAVWTKLKQWWLRKRQAFVTASDTSTWSLKMETEDAGRSPLMNYHINVG